MIRYDFESNEGFDHYLKFIVLILNTSTVNATHYLQVFGLNAICLCLYFLNLNCIYHESR